MAWYNDNWNYRVKITVDNTKVASDLTNFPVYVDLGNLPADFHTNVNQTDGRDIRVTKSDGTTELAREVVFYDSTNDTGELHFKADSISSSTDTDFYIYYGNTTATEPAVTDTYGRNAVWSDYKAVYHMNEAPNGTVIDSAGNTPFDANVNMDADDLITTGKIKNANKKETTEYWRNATGISFAAGNSFTFQAWLYPTSWPTGNPGVWRAGTSSNGTTFNIFNSNTGRPWIRLNGTNILQPTSGTGISLNTWTATHWVVQSATVAKLYANGSEAFTANHTTATPAFTINNLGWQFTTTEEVLGRYDEVRFRASVLTADWISAEYANQNSPSTFLATGAQEAKPSASWYNASWLYRVKITVLATKVSANLTDFPVYVDLTSLPTGFHTNVKTDGGDIRITTADGTTECAREVVSYDSTTDTGELHFKAPSLSSTIDTDFYVYYGNSGASEPAASATYGKNNVWTAYSGVWHGNDVSTTTVADSTSNAYTGTKLSSGNPTETTGKIGKAQEHTSDYVNMGDVLDMGTNDASFSQWVRTSAAITAAVHSLSKARAAAQDYRYSVRYDASGNAGFFIKGTVGADVIYASTTQIDDNAWHLIYVLFDRDGNGTVYVDGTSVGSTSISAFNGQDFQSTNPFRIGAYTASDNTGIFGPFPGAIDETRVRWSLVTGDWITTEYNNQNDFDTFTTIGAQEEPTPTGRVKVYNGTSWVVKPMKVYNGTSWVEKPVKFYNGSSFVT
jgi:hypothetical protein